MVDGAGSGALAGAIVVSGMIALKAVDVWLGRVRNGKNGNGSAAYLTEMRREVSDHHARHTAELRELCKEFREHHGEEVSVLTKIQANTDSQLHAMERLTDAVNRIGR